MITTEGLEGQLTALRNASPDSASAMLHQWCEKARSAVETAARATTPQQFDIAEAMLINVRQAVAVVRGKVIPS